MRLIDADAILKRAEESFKNAGLHGEDYRKFKKWLRTAPTIDAVEVVRCKECIHWFPHTQCGFDEDNGEYHDYCGLLIPDDDYYAYRRKANDYCSYGERREDGEV